MKTYTGGQEAGPGLYLCLRSGEFVQVSQESAVVPGDSDRRFARVPLPLVLVVGPLMGLAFVVFLPIAGIVGLVGYAAYRAGRLVMKGLRKVRIPGWGPLARLHRAGGVKPATSRQARSA